MNVLSLLHGIPDIYSFTDVVSSLAPGETMLIESDRREVGSLVAMEVAAAMGNTPLFVTVAGSRNAMARHLLTALRLRPEAPDWNAVAARVMDYQRNNKDLWLLTGLSKIETLDFTLREASAKGVRPTGLILDGIPSMFRNIRIEITEEIEYLRSIAQQQQIPLVIAITGCEPNRDQVDAVLSLCHPSGKTAASLLKHPLFRPASFLLP